MTVSVASRPVHNLTGISELGRAVLGFVDGGTQWLEWAIGDPGARYHFEDESALVAGVQGGLHASPFLIMPKLGLMVSPVKLMTVALPDLRVLDKSATVTAGVKRILTAHGLATQADLAAGTALLEQLKVAGAPLFQSMGLADRLAVLALLDDPGENQPDLQQEAAAFAVARAVTPPEYCDYLRAYLQLGTAGTKPKDRPAALDTLRPLLFAALDCPRVDGLVAPWEVSAAIEEWLMAGRQVGFSRLSLGVQQVIANTSFSQQAGDDQPRVVAAYLAAAQALLRSADLGRGELGQDGASCTFGVQQGTAEAVVALGPDGLITLSSFRPARQ